MTRALAKGRVDPVSDLGQQRRAGTWMDHYNLFGGQWSPRAALIWSPRQRATIELLFYEAFRPPSVTETASNGTFAALVSSGLRPLKTKMEELQFE
jgi:hypothetical protein